MSEEANVITILSKEDAEKPAGKYVIIRSFTDNTVICSDECPAHALKKAREKGITDGVIFFVPYPGRRFCFVSNN